MTDPEKTITDGARVTLHLDIYLQDDSIADSTRANNLPGDVVLGDGTFSENFEAQLMGMKKGDKKRFTLPPADAFGEHQAHLILTLPKAQFETLESLEKGLIVEFDSPQGPRPGVICAIDDAQVTVDFNHPLAGQTITFVAEIMAVN